MVTVNRQGYRIGEDHPRATIPNELVEAARAMREQDPPVPYAEIASRLRILSVRTVQGICQYRKRADTPNAEPPAVRQGHTRRGRRK